MSSDIKNILERMSVLEGKTTPVDVKHGLNAQQKSVQQLPALFKPKNISPTLSKKPYQKHPMDGKLVGDSVEPKQSALEEAIGEIEEDMVSKVKRDLTHYLEQLGQRINDDGRREGNRGTLNQLQKKQNIERDLKPKQDQELDKCSAKTYTMEDGSVIECYGDEQSGFELRRGSRTMSTRFQKIDDVDMAVKLYQRRKPSETTDQDYIEER